MEIKRFAAIDIGSNAMRLLIMNVIENGKEPVFKKASLVRVPVRLGHEVFTKGRIPEEKVDVLLNAIKSYKWLIKAFNVVGLRACATSAMREADNGGEVVELIKKKTGINVEIVSGKQEADIIYGTHIETLLDHKKSYMYVDVGGGSTEITIFSRNQLVLSKSFEVGTVRQLENVVNVKAWQSMKRWVKEHSSKYQPIYLIGSGGNINRLIKMARTSKKKRTPSITRDQIQKLYNEIISVPYEDRIGKFDMNPDRADVIIPASEIFLNIMKWAGSNKVYVPQIGLADGIIRELYLEYKEK